MMNKSALLSGALLPMMFSAAAHSATPQKNTKPDVLFIFVDDMTFNGVHALGTDDIISPNMDKIVKSGVSFTNNYNMGSWNGAVSQASRSQLMTGMFVWKTYKSQMDNKYQDLISQRVLWPQVMKDNGYKTFHTGKWHMVTVNPAILFDSVEAVRPGMAKDNDPVGYNRPLSRDDHSWEPWDTSMGGYWAGGKHWSEVQADITINYLNENKDSEQPLFITCAFNAPHDPRQSPKEYQDMYDVDDIALPVSFQPQHPYKEQMGAGSRLRDERLAPFPRTEYAVKKHRQEYYSIITHLDVQIGRIMEALEKSGRADNTLIVFAADNGLALGKHGLLGKQSLYEHSVKVPLVFVGCGLPKGETRNQLTYLQDLVPTVYEIAGIDAPDNLDYTSILDAVKSKNAKTDHEVIYCAYVNKQRMVRDQRYKLYMIPQAKKAYLFDLKNDPDEMVDLYGQKKYAGVVKKLAQKYREMAPQTGDELDITGAFPEIFE